MNRRIAYKVASAIVVGTSRHNETTKARALRVVKRDLRRGRLDGVFMAAALGLIDLGEWWKVNVAAPMAAFQEAAIAWAKNLAVAFEKVSRSMSTMFANVKIPDLEATRALV